MSTRPQRRASALSLAPDTPATVAPPAAWRAALTAAADAAAGELAEARDGGWPVAELRAGTSLLAAICEQHLHGIDGATIGLPPALPARRLVDAMRRSLLSAARDRVLDTAETLQLVDALESIAIRLDDDAAHRFASRLGGMDGLALIVDVAHDMRSPLGSILFLAEQIRRGSSGAVSPVQERQLGLIYGAALGLSTMASDVMDLARGGEKLVQHEPRPFSVPSVFQQVEDLVRPMAEERRLALRFETAITEPRLGQAQAVQRVILNLVSNAVKFTPEGEVTVTATACGAGRRVRFEVRDTGRGIPEAVMGTLFDAFRRRVKPGEYVFSSAGLGLSICQSLLRAMGGELLVESRPGSGSSFQFELDLPPSAPI